MTRDPRIVMFGEDVADCSREENLGDVKGKGGVFKVTWGLAEGVRQRSGVQLAARRGEHHRPSDRPGHPRPQAGRRDPVLRLHLAGVHAAPQRARPHALALEQRLLRRRWSSASPTVGTSRAGRSTTRRPAQRSSRSVPGLRVVCPSTALDANGLLRTAIRCDDPVLFLEHKHLYRQTYNKAP